jgi:hypothetical protein
VADGVAASLRDGAAAGGSGAAIGAGRDSAALVGPGAEALGDNGAFMSSTRKVDTTASESAAPTDVEITSVCVRTLAALFDNHVYAV